METATWYTAAVNGGGMTARYASFSRYLRGRFGCRVRRVPLDGGFTCPVRDGSLSAGGCLYCDERGASSSPPGVPVREQLLRGIESARRRYGAKKFIAYFQAFTGTYGPPGELARRYAEGTDHPDVVALAIATRPDCAGEAALDAVAPFAARMETWIEYGLQSAHDGTLRLLRRGHTAAAFADAARRTAARGIKVCAHVIIGLPGETGEMERDTARFLASLPVSGVKIHLLHVLRGSALDELHRRGGVALLSRDDYARRVCDVLELLPPEIVIQRLTGEAPPGRLVAPLWALRKQEVLGAIAAELDRRGSRQGARADSAGDFGRERVE